MTDPGAELKVQLEFWGRLKKFGVRLCFGGVMDIAQRWEVIRRAIVEFDMADELCGKTETFGRAFERITGTPLTETA